MPNLVGLYLININLYFSINNSVKFYIYSCQDLIVKNDTSAHISAGEIYCIEIEDDEDIFVYFTTHAGVLIINSNILHKQVHGQINYYKLDNQNILCEIIPFLPPSQNSFCINNSVLNIVNSGGVYVYFNNNYYGKILDVEDAPIFEKINRNGKDYGLIKFDKKKYIIFFSETKILYCGRYVDYEILNNYIQIYEHVPNIFDLGKLVKYTFETNMFSVKCVNDRGKLHIEKNTNFLVEFFMEALKCERFKYAYEKLSYELRSDISIDVLKQYFKQFDEYKYIETTKTYITLKNHKIVGVYKFVTSQNFIENIY